MCACSLDDTAAVLACVRAALDADLPPALPADMAREAYLERLKGIVGGALG